jgi:hypothetical protein
VWLLATIRRKPGCSQAFCEFSSVRKRWQSQGLRAGIRRALRGTWERVTITARTPPKEEVARFSSTVSARSWVPRLSAMYAQPVRRWLIEGRQRDEKLSFRDGRYYVFCLDTEKPSVNESHGIIRSA